MSELQDLLQRIEACTICARHLEHGVRPVVRAGETARILIAGQAPGRIVHETGIPFNDKSGERLRDWLGIDEATFYDTSKIAILPMGFCYPGTGKSGDLPPRPECAPAWRQELLDVLPQIALTIAVGQYATNYHLGARQYRTLTETVRNHADYGPTLIPLPHPSPRNNIWLRKNPWFEEDVLPVLKARVIGLLQGKGN